MSKKENDVPQLSDIEKAEKLILEAKAQKQAEVITKINQILNEAGFELATTPVQITLVEKK